MSIIFYQEKCWRDTHNVTQHLERENKYKYMKFFLFLIYLVKEFDEF